MFGQISSVERQVCRYTLIVNFNPNTTFLLNQVKDMKQKLESG